MEITKIVIEDISPRLIDARTTSGIDFVYARSSVRYLAIFNNRFTLEGQMDVEGTSFDEIEIEIMDKLMTE